MRPRRHRVLMALQGPSSTRAVHSIAARPRWGGGRRSPRPSAERDPAIGVSGNNGRRTSPCCRGSTTIPARKERKGRALPRTLVPRTPVVRLLLLIASAFQPSAIGRLGLFSTPTLGEAPKGRAPEKIGVGVRARGATGKGAGRQPRQDRPSRMDRHGSTEAGSSE